MKVLLKTNDKINPIGTDKRPKFSWQVSDTNIEDDFILSYRIFVYDGTKKIVWDSGTVFSKSCIVEYDGEFLKGATKYFWKVILSTETEIYKSSEASFVTGLDIDEWKAKWIDGGFCNAPIFKKDVKISEIDECYAFISGLGYFELYINDVKVGDDLFVPSQTDYEEISYSGLQFKFDGITEKRIFYLGYEVSKYLKPGENSIKVILGNGWYRLFSRSGIEGKFEYDNLKMIFELRGKNFEILSDESWQVSNGFITQNDLFYGEKHMAIADYSPNFRSVKTANRPKALFVPQTSPTDKVMEKIKPEKISEKIYDAGKNLSGYVKITLKGKYGTKVTVSHSECLKNMNELDFKSTVGYVEDDKNQIQRDEYILSGDGEEVLFPHFVWHTFRYFKIEAEDVLITDIEVDFIYTGIDNITEFDCSNEVLNGIHNMYINSQKQLIHGSVPMDCPHRERLGYTGDGQAASLSAMSNFDCRYFYKKWIEDIFGAQDKTSGYVPHTAPFRGGAGGPGWGSAIAIIPWRYYVYYKDKKFLKQALPYIEKWINYLKGRLNQKGLINGDDDTGWGLGDWCLPLGEDIEWSNPRDDLIKLPAELVNTCFFVYCIKIYNKILNVLNENGYCFSEELDCAVKAVNNEFLGECYGEGIQGSDAFALYMEIVPPEKKKAVVESLKKNIENNGYTFDTGIFGTGYTLYALAKNGLNHYAYKMLTNVRYPSYGYMYKMGATSVWETWEGTGSRVHSALVCYDSWIIRELAGIKPAEDDAADYNISPFFEREISFLNVKLKTNNGKICVGWNREEKTVFRVSVPFNTTARVFCNNEIKICTKGDYEFIID